METEEQADGIVDIAEPEEVAAEAPVSRPAASKRISISGFVARDAPETIHRPTQQRNLPSRMPKVVATDPEARAEDNREMDGELEGRRPGEPLKERVTYPKGSHRFGTYVFLETSMRAQRPHEIIIKPDMIALPEWHAVHVTLFYNQASELYGKVYEECQTKSTRGDVCAQMRGGKHAEYLFSDGAKGNKEPASAPAHKYIKHLLDWAESLLANPSIFPIRDFASYSPGYDKAIRLLMKRLFRVFAHLNYAHRADLRERQLEIPQKGTYEDRLDQVLMHFLFYVKRFHLMDRREFDVLKHLHSKFMHQLGLMTEEELTRQEERRSKKRHEHRETK